MDLSEAWQSARGLAEHVTARLPYIGLGLAVFLTFYLAGRAVRWTVLRVTVRRRRHRNVGVALGRLAQWTIALVGSLVGLVIAIPTFKPGQLIQLLGISSVAIGFAFRDILQNFLAGILLLLAEPFRIGDQIVVGAFEGTVEDIQTRATMIRTYDGRLVVIPNADLFTDTVVVNTAFAHRRLEYDVGIGYGDDVARAKALMLSAMRRVPGVLDEPAPDVLVYALAPSSVTLRARWWIEPPRRADALTARDAVITAIKATLTAHGIELPFPTQTVLLQEPAQAVDGGRGRPDAEATDR